MPTDVQNLVSQRLSCHRHRPSEKHQKLMKLFSSLRHFRLVTIDMLLPLMRTKPRNWFIVVMTDSFLEADEGVSCEKKYCT